MEEEKHTYQGKEETKIIISVSIFQSVIDSVKERQAEFGGKISPLIENLLCGWVSQYDRLNHPERIKKLEQQVKKEEEKKE